MEIDISTKLKQLFDLLMAIRPSKKVPLEILNPLFSKINIVMCILDTSQKPNLPDEIMKMLFDFLEELKAVLEKISSEGNGLLRHLMNFLPGSNLKHLEGMLPRLDDIYCKIAKNLSVQSRSGDKSLNVKRKSPEGDEDEDLETEVGASICKKVKAETQPQTGITKEVDQPLFFVKYIYASEIQQYLAEKEVYKYPNIVEPDGKSVLTITREEFDAMPVDTALRLSREHACIQARRKNNDIVYELQDLSLNGTFLLGNAIEGKFETPPKRLQKRKSYHLKHGDRKNGVFDEGLKSQENGSFNEKTQSPCNNAATMSSCTMKMLDRKQRSTTNIIWN